MYKEPTLIDTSEGKCRQLMSCIGPIFKQVSLVLVAIYSYDFAFDIILKCLISMKIIVLTYILKIILLSNQYKALVTLTRFIRIHPNRLKYMTNTVLQTCGESKFEVAPSNNEEEGEGEGEGMMLRGRELSRH